ncbi:MAG: alkaline phosphatase family protein [Bdellovibrionaceae bacterium]|nr:alkaline phosphatase family protein [Pseudobdellovibrionaceae bacterium]NUM58704.1 hypothetical protein [Pseudobdellovibrionaceae bacterium]
MFQRSYAIFIFIFFFFLTLSSFAIPRSGKYFDRVIFVVFENTNYSDVIKQDFFAKLAVSGANFTNFMAITHPSQGNYVALTSGSLNGVKNDNNVDLNVYSVVDLLESKGLTWKVYAENYPGNCFIGNYSNGYVRKHNPFISYLNIQKNPARCANIVEATQFDRDAANGKLPNYVFYIPNLKNDGHDTGVNYANRWYQQRFTPYLSNANFMTNTIVITTFDESSMSSSTNQIYTSIVGINIRQGNYPQPLSTYSLLRLVEENWNLGSLGKEDAKAPAVPNIWK